LGAVIARVLMFYRGTQTFPQWNGNGFIGGMGTQSLTRVIFDGKAAPKTPSAGPWQTNPRCAEGPMVRCGCWKTPRQAP